ncbi:MAG: hypothetical protein M3388_19145 [Acidobacteriota bacterium]|nr:hypothetical protein [Acidobacteriota bacterium]
MGRANLRGETSENLNYWFGRRGANFGKRLFGERWTIENLGESNRRFLSKRSFLYM